MSDIFVSCVYFLLLIVPVVLFLFFHSNQCPAQAASRASDFLHGAQPGRQRRGAALLLDVPTPQTAVPSGPAAHTGKSTWFWSHERNGSAAV